MNIIVNEKHLQLKDKGSLKDLLISEGLFFPCDGKGICGKCRIICPELQPTELDKRFLSLSQIGSGLRLACDKIVTDNINISFDKILFSKKIKMEECNIAIIIDTKSITIGILDEELVEKVVIPNDCFSTIELRSVIAKHCIEFFEKYSLAKADTIAVATTAPLAEMLLGIKTDGEGESLDALDYMLPAETLYLLPFVDNIIGGDFLSKALGKSLPRIVVSADDTFVAGLFSDNDIFCLSHENMQYSPLELVALKASIKLLISYTERPPIISVYGKNREKISSILKEYSYVIEEDDSLEMVARTTNENRLKNQLFKMRKKISILETIDNDRWQEEFVLSANNSDN